MVPLLILAALCSLALAQQIPPRYIFVFGDSYSTTGFNPSGAQPASYPANPIGNPALPGNTTDNGANWLGVVLSKHAPPDTLAYDYGAIGAVVNMSRLEPYGAPGQNFDDQVRMFFDGRANWSSSPSVFVVWFGVNDVKDYPLVDERAAMQPQSLYNDIMNDYFGQLSMLYQAGAREFLLLEVPPFNRSQYPTYLNATYRSALNTGIPLFNSALHSHAQQFSSSHGDARLSILDTAPAFNRVLDDPQAWGAPDAHCINANGVSCLWWDTLHPGQAIQGQLGDAVAAQLASDGFFDVQGSPSASVDELKLWAMLRAEGVPVS